MRFLAYLCLTNCISKAAVGSLANLDPIYLFCKVAIGFLVNLGYTWCIR